MPPLLERCRRAGTQTGSGDLQKYQTEEFVMLRAAENGRALAIRMGSRKVLAGLSFGVESRKSQSLGGKFEDTPLKLIRNHGQSGRT